MWHRESDSRGTRLGGAAAAAGVAAGLVLGLTPAAQAATPGTLSATGTETTHAVTLVTGDHVLVRDVAGRQAVSVAPRAGSTGGFVTQRAGGDLYVIPVTALPYLDRSLDRSLFDVSALIRDGATQATPVRVSYVNGASTAPAAGPEFGAALAKQAGADAATHYTGDATLFGSVSSVKLAAAGEPQQATPHFPMHTVKINAVDEAGKPTTASLGVINTDDGRMFSGFTTAVNGEARISVPSGNYNMVSFFPKVDAKGNLLETRMVTSDFSVTGDATVGIDARKATSLVSVSTPKASTQTGISLGYFRKDARNFYSLGYSFAGGNAPSYVAPTGATTVGSMHFNVQIHSESAAGTADPYVYDLKLDNAGAIAANQHYRVTADQLATLKENYYSDEPARHEATGRIIFLPYEDFGFGTLLPLTAPVRRTEYVGGSADQTYSDAVVANMDTFGGFAVDGLRRYTPQSTTPVDWLRGPLAPGFTTQTLNPNDTSAAWYCNACRKDDTLALHLSPVLDSSGHSMYLDPPADGTVSTSHFQLLSGGTTLLDGKDIVGGLIPAPPQQADYKLIYDQTRTAPWFHQSTVSHSEWTFGSVHSGTQTVPANWFCDPDGKTTDCSPLSLVTANYQLNTGLDGTSPAGPEQVVVTFGHTAGAANLPFSKASVDVSFDGGATWTPTFFADLGNNHYRAQWTNPASAKGGDVALRISGTDAAGYSLTQTVTGAFTIAPAA